MRSASRRGSWVAQAVVTLAAVVFAVPVIYMVDMALRGPAQSFSPRFITGAPTLSNFVTVLGHLSLLRYFFNSTFVAVSTTVLTVVIGSLAAFAFSRLRVPFERVLFPLLLAELMVPLASLLIPLTVLLKFLGLVNTEWGLIGPYTAIGIPFALVVFRGAMDDFPAALEEAARIDGCTDFQIYRRILMPLVAPAVMVVAIWQFLFSWNEFFLALVIVTRNSVKTLPLAPLAYQGDFMTSPGELFAILTLIAIVPILVYSLLQRSFVQGLTAGGVKA